VVETKVTDAGWKPAGTGPPGGAVTVVVVDAGVVLVVGADVDVVVAGGIEVPADDRTDGPEEQPPNAAVAPAKASATTLLHIKVGSPPCTRRTLRGRDQARTGSCSVVTAGVRRSLAMAGGTARRIPAPIAIAIPPRAHSATPTPAP